MAYIDKHGVEFSDDRKTLIKCPKDFHGEYVIPNGVTRIGKNAFRNCKGLNSITIPNSVTSIGDEAFSSCRGLTSVHISDIAAWCAIFFRGYKANPFYYSHNIYLNETLITDLVIPNSVKKIVGGAFCFCSCLTSVTIPNSVTSIGGSAFYECSGLTSVTIPDSVTSIEDDAFSGCRGLTSITIPNSVISIGDHAFFCCSGLTSLTIPNSVKCIGWNAFSCCSGLTSVEISNSVTSIGSGAFSVCSGLTSVTIPNNVTSIGDRAFYSCSGLTSVTIPNSVTSIGDGAFYGCRGLTTVTIPDSVTNIGDAAFYNCSSLTSVTIGNRVTSIEEFTFCHCSALHKILIHKGQKERFAQMKGIKRYAHLIVEKEDFLNEHAVISQILHKHRITCFYHFTSRKNLESIRKHGGLYSWQYLKKNEIAIPVQGGGELSQGLDLYNGVADYVHLSFCESHPMAYHHKQDGEDIVVLKISTEVALLDDTKFSDMNAVDSKCRCEQGLKGLKLVNFAATKEKFLTNDNPLFKYKQAEILVKTHVPLEYILNIDEF